MRLSVCCVSLLLLPATISAFQAIGANNPRSNLSGQTTRLYQSSADASSTLLSKYMASAHEAKLQAVQDAEAKKQAEIDALKTQLAQLQEQEGAKPVSHKDRLMALSKEELVETILQYREFTAHYIVKNHQDRVQAVRDAEAAVHKKWLEKMKPSSEAVAVVEKKETAGAAKSSPLFAERNEAVAAAGVASRWGEKEVERASSAVGTAVVKSEPAAVETSTPASVKSSEAAAVSSTAAPPPPEVVAADHGMRADGGVGGLSLAERVAMGAGAPTGTGSSSDDDAAYQDRNEALMAAGKSSRWSDNEIARLQTKIGSVSPNGSTTKKKVNGDMGAISLEERVNLGAAMLVH